MKRGISFTASSPSRSSFTPWPDAIRPLPLVVRQYIERGAAEGERNDTIYKVAQQFHACGYSQQEAETWIMPMATGQGGPVTEIKQAIGSAYRSSVVTKPIEIHRPVVGIPTSGPRHGNSRVATPSDPFQAALEAAFEPGEVVAICSSWQPDGGDWIPGKGDLRKRETWLKHSVSTLIDAGFGGDGGAFIAINPMKDAGAAKGNDNVAAFRHVLAEWDKDVPPEEQERRLRASGLPISVLVSSGGRSVHGWVRVDAVDLKTWQERRDRVFQTLDCDRKNKDVARVSRLPGALRGDREQKLLATSIGASSWAEWEGKGGELPSIISFADLIKAAPQPPPEVVHGVLYQGTKMMVGGPSKARKSWVLLDLCLSVVAGVPWMGFPVTQGKVLYVNFELKDFMLYDRLGKIAKSRKMVADASLARNFSIWNLRGRIHDIAVLTPTLLQKMEQEKYTLVVIDPIYKGLGDRDENAAGDISELLNHLERVSDKTGAAVVYSHHFAKGNASEKTSLDRVSGSGVWAREPDTAISLTPPPPQPKAKRGEKQPEKPDWDFEVEVTARAHPRLEPFHVFWRGFHYEREVGRTFVLKPREGSPAALYGPILLTMPPLPRDAAEEWFRQKADIPMADAKTHFHTLSQKARYSFLSYDESSKIWVGNDHKEPDPF